MSNISKSTLAFLRDLAVNNNRDWFQANKAIYDLAHTEVKAFCTALQYRMEALDKIERLKLYRIYRDVRFSKDKSPYKNHFSGGLVRASKQLRGGYYFGIEPNGKSSIGGGFYNPNAADLKLIRKKIQQDAQPLRNILADETFVKYFEMLSGNKVKTAPKGFSKEDPNIDLLRYKQFYAMRSFTDKEVTATDFLDRVVDTYLALRPYFDYMSEVLTTDMNGVPLYED